MILYYNREGIGDTLIVYLKEGGKESFERRSDIARIYDPASNETSGYNFFKASRLFNTVPETGQVKADMPLVDRLNQALTDAGFSDLLESNDHPTIVTGYVEKMKKHPDSDHMHVCHVDVGSEKLQIVCGAPNIEEGQKVVVAKIGALMPGGMIIRPTTLRGVASDGMICSARELALPGAPQKRGILVLDQGTEVGRDFYSLTR
ncbi:DUF4479 domain-containing protein [Sporolactobacillus sp. THM7-4]|nr:DUF4479 domain-containing protein [Sporolactobacillus sp. THM7-4]